MGNINICYKIKAFGNALFLPSKHRFTVTNELVHLFKQLFLMFIKFL